MNFQYKRCISELIWFKDSGYFQDKDRKIMVFPCGTAEMNLTS